MQVKILQGSYAYNIHALNLYQGVHIQQYASTGRASSISGF